MGGAYPGRVPLVVYTLLRLAVLVVAFLVVWWVGAEPLLAGVVAVVVASAVSYLFLRKQRDAATTWIAARAERRKATKATQEPKGAFARGVAADEAAEDAAADR